MRSLRRFFLLLGACRRLQALPRASKCAARGYWPHWVLLRTCTESLWARLVSLPSPPSPPPEFAPAAVATGLGAAPLWSLPWVKQPGPPVSKKREGLEGC